MKIDFTRLNPFVFLGAAMCGLGAGIMARGAYYQGGVNMATQVEEKTGMKIKIVD